MKAERRHELKQNTLARGLETLPDVSRRHGSKVMFGVLAVLALILLVRWRITASRGEAEQAAFALNTGRDLIQRLDEAAEKGVPPAQLASFAQEVAKGVDQSVTQVLEATTDPKMVAEARLVQGDLNWKLANFPEFPGATTRPQLALPKSDEQLLASAADAYQAALAVSPPVESAVSARLGLAAVHENRREWDKAKEQYQKVVDDAAVPKPLKDVAAAAMSRLVELRKPPLVAPPTTMQLDFLGRPIPPTTGPATGPATTQGTTGPATGPAIGPATSPVTAPATGDAKPQAAPGAAQPAAPQPAPAPQNPGHPG